MLRRSRHLNPYQSWYLAAGRAGVESWGPETQKTPGGRQATGRVLLCWRMVCATGGADSRVQNSADRNIGGFHLYHPVFAQIFQKNLGEHRAKSILVRRS